MNKRSFSLGISLGIAAAVLMGSYCANAQTPDGKGQVCRMEQQCHWENFKKHCVWVKVCR
jgi:predicted small secreted protein